MRFQDIQRQKTWLRQVQVYIDEIGEPVEAEYGFCQAITARDGVGVSECLNYFFSDLTFSVDPKEVGLRWYDIRYEKDKDYFRGVPAVAPVVDETIAEQPDWNRIALGKCRHGVLCAFINSGANIYDIDLNRVNQLAKFSMTGEIDDEYGK